MIQGQWVITGLNVIAIAMNAGCSQSLHPESIYAVSWYETHNEDRTARLQRCKENDGSEGGSPNCMNAQAALRQLQARPNQKSVADGVKLP